MKHEFWTAYWNQERKIYEIFRGEKPFYYSRDGFDWHYCCNRQEVSWKKYYFWSATLKYSHGPLNGHVR